MDSGIYYNLFSLLHEHIYGFSELTADMNLTLTLLATAGSVFVVSLPFILVWQVIKLFR